MIEFGRDAKYAEVFFIDLSTNPQLARDYLPCVFHGRQVHKILRLKDGSDISHVKFDRRYFVPRTNPIYVEMEDMTPEATSSRASAV
jgi:hypothetical protein